MTVHDKELADIAELMSFKINRRVVWRLLELAGVFRSSFAIETPAMAFNEGQRNIGLVLLADIMAACPERLQQMMKEAKELEDERRILEQSDRDKRRDNGELVD